MNTVGGLTVQAFLFSLFRHLDQENILYCVLRDHDRLEQLTSGTELDLLVGANHLASTQRLLNRLGFVRLPSWGHAPHHFFVGYDQSSDSWLKVDITTAADFGQPVAALHTDLAGHCLENRRRAGSVYIPRPECELVMLLLHCVLDKGTIAPLRSERLQALRHQVEDEEFLAALLTAYWLPTVPWPALAALIERGEWSALMAMQGAVAARLTQQDPLGARWRRWRGRVLRKLNVTLTARRPVALTVALLAPDGAGKSTLAGTLQASFYFPVRSLYMGLYQKGKGGEAVSRAPGLGLAQRLGGQWRRYLKARYYQQRGQLVIFDRYIYDAWLPVRGRQNPLQKFRRWLLAHSVPAPDLVVLLDAPGELLHRRKGEHTAEQLEQQRQSYLRLRPLLPQLTVVDATQEADQVRREVTALIWRLYLRRQAGKRPAPAPETSAAYLEGSVNS